MLRRSRTFGSKLLLVVIVTSGVAATLVCAAFLIRNLLDKRRMTVEMLHTHAEVIAVNSTAALAFEDTTSGAQTLASLQPIPAIEGAVITKSDGSTFAEFLRPGSTVALRPMPEGHGFEAGKLIVSEAIRLRGEHLGNLTLYYDMQPTYMNLAIDSMIGVGIAVAAMGVALFLGLYLRRQLARPIGELVQVAKSVSEQRNYSYRARRHTDDDLGDVIDVFNGMLDVIEARDAELEQGRNELEERVRIRTAELETAKLRAEAASQAKTDFLANMSHEIRTPMTAIIGYSELLQDPEQSQSERLDSVQTIRRNGKHLLGIINDILDLSKIEAGRMSVEMHKTSVVELVADIASLMRIRGADRGIDFRVEYRGRIPEHMTTDPMRLRQILVNLLGNAFKFTNDGGVRLIVEMRQTPDDDHQFICFDIVDTGVGIAPEHIDKLFSAFSQADESVTRRFGGTGLGLAISKQLAKLLGGDISVESELGKGATFSVKIRAGDLRNVRFYQQPHEIEASVEQLILGHQSPAPLSTSAPLSCRVLVAEDGVDNQRLIRHILEKAGADVTLVENGKLAVQTVQEAIDAKRPFGLILMDMQMPEMDGYTATRTLRDLGVDTPIVALTAHAMQGDRDRCLEAGCNEYMSKPINRAKLLDLVRSKTLVSGPDVSAQIHGDSEMDRNIFLNPNGKSAAGGGSLPPLRSEFADDEDMLELIESFIAELPERVYRIERAALEKDLKTLASLSHQLKGAAGGYGYSPITEQAKQLESQARSEKDLQRIHETVAELKSLCDRAKAGLQEQGVRE